MVKRSVFERGDIIRVCLNPTSGRELQGDFPLHWYFRLKNLMNWV